MKKQLIYVYPSLSSFVKVDEAILSSQYRITKVCLNQDKGKFAYLCGLIKLAFCIFTNSRIKLVTVWFADYHAMVAVFLANLLKMKSVVLIGGYDAVCYPEFRYGVFTHKLRGWCAAYALRHTDLIIANHEALLSSQNLYYNPKGHPEGVFQLVPGLKTKAEVIYNSITVDNALPVDSIHQNQILCVGGTPRYNDTYNKGFDLIFSVAALEPDWHFVLVGIDQQWMPGLEKDLAISKLKNVVILPAIPHEEVLDLMQTSSIYVQPSISEGMPNALMEAMLHGCIPVGSNVAGIPTLIGEWGVIFNQRKATDFRAAIQRAMDLQPDRQAISNSIWERFNPRIRQQALLENLRKLADSKKP